MDRRRGYNPPAMRAWWIPCLALAGCATRPLPPPAPLPSAADPWDRVVASFDGRPVHLRDVVRTAVDVDLHGMLRRHLVRLLVERKRAEFGIANTDDERLARARAAVAAFQADPAFAESLRRSGVSEEHYVRSYARTPQLEARLVTEKIVATALLLSESAEIDLLGFDRREDAERYLLRADLVLERALCGACRGGESGCDEHSLPRPAARIDGLRVVQSALAEDLGEGAESAIFAAKPGDRIGPAREKSGAWAVVQVVARHGPRPGADAMELLLSDPPDDLEIKTYFDWLLRSSPIAIERKD
jgi:hypothetical protein